MFSYLLISKETKFLIIIILQNLTNYSTNFANINFYNSIITLNLNYFID